MVRSPIFDRNRPTVERLRRDIDEGYARDKVACRDPAIAPLGADAEAGGAPPSATEIQDASREGPLSMQAAERDIAPERRDGAAGRFAVPGEARSDDGAALSWRRLALGAVAFGLAGGMFVALRFG